MRVLVIGSGGREHALAWRLRQSASVTHVLATPGNPGIAQVADCVSVPDLLPKTLLRLAQERAVDLTVVGPEAPLVAGVVDAFRDARLKIIGPTAAQAQLEGSKIYAKRFFAEHRIPTAAFHTVNSAGEVAHVLDRSRFPVVIKADGLAAGKGVVIAQNRAEADRAAVALGPDLVIEEYLEGDEVSFIVLSDGRNVFPFEPSQDHKRVFDGDRGPNTGGMGAYSDSNILSAAQTETILDTVIRPTVEATGFTGWLYAGLIMTTEGPKLLEFNVRLGDPETQVLMARFRGDLGALLQGSLDSHLSYNDASRPNPAVCVVLASAGYPAGFQSGVPIGGLDAVAQSCTTVFHSGTRLGANGQIETAGGRVLGVTAQGSTLQDAIDSAYAGVDRIHFSGMHYRRDIGRKGLGR